MVIKSIIMEIYIYIYIYIYIFIYIYINYIIFHNIPLKYIQMLNESLIISTCLKSHIKHILLTIINHLLTIYNTCLYIFTIYENPPSFSAAMPWLGSLLHLCVFLHPLRNAAALSSSLVQSSRDIFALVPGARKKRQT